MTGLTDEDKEVSSQEQQGLLSPFLRRQRYKNVTQYITADDLVLDLGCGAGGLKEYLPQSTGYYGTDGQEHWAQGAAHLFVNKIEDPLPVALQNMAFTVVVSLAVLEHLKDPALLLRKASDALVGGGKLVITTPHPIGRRVHEIGAAFGVFSRDASEEHEEFYNKDALQRLAKNSDFKLVHYSRFLFGVNQLAVFEKI